MTRPKTNKSQKNPDQDKAAKKPANKTEQDSAQRSKAKRGHCEHARCKNKAVMQGYCRLHYISNWKAIKFNQHVKAEQRLNTYVDRLVKKYPNQYLDKIKEALESDEKFKETIDDLELDSDAENHETDREFLEKFVRNIKAGD